MYFPLLYSKCTVKHYFTGNHDTVCRKTTPDNQKSDPGESQNDEKNEKLQNRSKTIQNTPEHFRTLCNALEHTKSNSNDIKIQSIDAPYARKVKSKKIIAKNIENHQIQQCQKYENTLKHSRTL